MKKKRERSIFSRLLALLILVLLMQVAVYLLVFRGGGVVEQTEQNAFYILSERTANRRLYLENEMLRRWANTQEAESDVLRGIGLQLASEERPISALGVDQEFCQDIVGAVAPDILSLLRRNGATGAFLVLNCPGADGDYPGIYVRDYDPASFSADNADLLLERGLPKVARENGLPMDSYWSASFRFDDPGADNARFFFAPLEAAQAAPVERRSGNYFYYWSGAFSLSGLDREVITYSIPLVWTDGTVVGVLGVDVTTDYLASQLKYEELDADQLGAYFLGISRDGGRSYTPVCESGPSFRADFGQPQVLYSEPAGYDKTVSLSGGRDRGSTRYGAVQNLELYHVNTPFEGEQWALIGILEGERLLSFARHIDMLLTLSLVAALALGLVLVVLAARTLTRPITRLVGTLQKSDPDKPIRLERIRIAEIDTLTEAIESLSHAAVESAARTATILEMTQIPIGVFEYRKGSGRVFCSRRLFGILGWGEGAETDGYLDYGEFRRRMQQVEEVVYDREERIFRLRDPDSRERWIQITYSEDDLALLGAIQDVSRDMEVKRRMEYERDFDVLTSLFNRRAFYQHMERLFAPGKIEALGVAAMLMCDLDNLKYVNDTYGHDSGDRYIQSFARALEFFYQTQSVVGRRSGDEFNVFLYGFSSQEEIRGMVAGFWERVGGLTMALPNGTEIKIRVSGGLAWYPQDADSYDELFRKADFAMYNIKHTVKGIVEEFKPREYERKSILLHGQEALNRLLENHLVRYAFQPIVVVEDGGILGYEMLMRPQVKQLANLGDLFQLARSESKLSQIEQLTWYESLSAFSQAAQSGRVGEDALVFVNSMGGQELGDSFAATLEQHFGPILNRVVMELTEGESFQREVFERKRRKVKEWRCGLALDDYGSGFNSQSVLIVCCPDLIKVDISIIRGIDRDAAKQKLLSNIISYARERGILVLAEGVETAEELEAVVRMGVDLLQGFYLARPDFVPPSLTPERRAEIRALAERYRGG